MVFPNIAGSGGRGQEDKENGKPLEDKMAGK
jgi:hypothetical protein